MSNADNTGQTSISHAQTLDELAEFWDTHSPADCWDATQDADFAVRAEQRHHVTLASEIYAEIVVLAQRRGLAPKTLVNLWLQERLQHSG